MMRQPGRYILDERGEPVQEPNLFTWAAWMEENRRVVKQEDVGDFKISTVFLALDHNFADDDSPPFLWETMVFSNHPNAPCGLDEETDRCAGSREQAEAMHERMKERVEAVCALALPAEATEKPNP